MVGYVSIPKLPSQTQRNLYSQVPEFAKMELIVNVGLHTSQTHESTLIATEFVIVVSPLLYILEVLIIKVHKLQ